MTKTCIRSFLLVLASVVILNGCNGGGGNSSLSSSSSSSASSSQSEISHKVTTKTLDVYEKESKQTSIPAYFLDDIDAPYIDIQSLGEYIVSKPGDLGFTLPSYTYSYSDGVLEAKNTYGGNTYSLFIDGNKDEIRTDYYLESLDIYHDNAPFDLVDADTSPIIKAVDIETKKNPVTISSKEYNIDLYSYNEMVLMPLAIANSLFFNTGEKRFSYNGKAIFETTYLTSGTASYKAYTSYSEETKNAARNEDTALFNRDCTFFILNTFFGRKDESIVHDFRDFAKSLGIYDDLGSTDPLTSYIALVHLIEGVDDLHTRIESPSPSIGLISGTDSKDKALHDAYVEAKNEAIGYRYSSYMTKYYYLSSLRTAALGDSPAGFSYSGDTCIIRFDAFSRADNSLVFLSDHKIDTLTSSSNAYTLFYNAFADIKANHPEVTNIVIDDSINGGGDATTLIEILGFFMETVRITYKQTMTGVPTTISYKVDTNYDGLYDEKDYMASGYEVYCLTSGVSFSCGNLMPLILHNSDSATIIGGTSGGGSCIIANVALSSGDEFRMSSSINAGTLNDDGSFVSCDQGVHPSIAIDETDFYKISTLLSYLPTHVS